MGEAGFGITTQLFSWMLQEQEKSKELMGKHRGLAGGLDGLGNKI